MLPKKEMANLRSDSSEIVLFAQRRLSDSRGFLKHELNASGLSSIDIHHDLGDITPFLVFLGYREYCNEILGHLIERLDHEKFLISQSKTKGFVSGLAKSYEYTDYLIGLDDLQRNNYFSGTTLITSELKKLDLAFRHNTFPRSYYYPKAKISFPILDTRDALFIEIYCDVAETLEDPKMTRKAKSLADVFIGILNSDNFGLLPDFRMPKALSLGLLYSNSYTTMKNQTNALQALLSLFRNTQSSGLLSIIKSYFNSLLGALSDGRGRIYDSPNQETASLKASFAVLDFICDYTIDTLDESFLPVSIKIAEFWTEHMGRTCLFPIREGRRDSFFDSQNDMAIAFWRLGGILGNNNLLRIGDLAFSGSKQFHVSNSFPLSVDIDTGEVIDSAIRTKFVFLYLKTLIASAIRNFNPGILNESTEVRRLIRDR